MLCKHLLFQPTYPGTTAHVRLQKSFFHPQYSHECFVHLVLLADYLGNRLHLVWYQRMVVCLRRETTCQTNCFGL